MPKLDLDAIDCRLLDALQGEARLSNVDLAERVGLSASPCLRRVKILEREGVIQGYRATLDRRKIGLALTVFVGLKIERHRDQEATAFQQAMLSMPQVVACHLISGEHDFLLEVVVASLEAYEEFLLGTLLKLPGVSDVRSNFAIRMVKPPGPLSLEHLPRG